MSKKVVTMGELMMRLSPVLNKRFLQTEQWDINFGGAEGNVGVLLSHLGFKSSFVTRLPQNPIGDMAVEYLNKNGVDTSFISRGGERVGIYYFEKGNSVRSSNVVYDRKYSAMTEATKEDFNLDEIFKDADWFHFSGITPALGQNNIELIREAIEVCKKYGVKISIDLNFRSKLWSYKEFKKVMKELIKEAYLCIGWIDLVDKDDNFKPVSFKDEKEEDEYFKRVVSEMKKELGIKYMATTIRETFSSTKNSLRGIMCDGENIIRSNKYEFEILDRVGAGDAFAAGLIGELVNGKELTEALEFGVASGVYKHTIEGDASIAAYDEIKSIMNGMLAGGVAR